MREAARQYTDQLLEAVENIVSRAMASANANYNDQINSLSQYYETIISNRTELNPPVAEGIDDMENDEEEPQEEALNADMLK